jgi:hypothetical protein
MEYVMVPVPDEYVVDVMQYVARLVARASVIPWTQEALDDFFDEVDEANRSLLAFVARSTVAGREVSAEDAAQALELNAREIREMAREIREASERNKYEPLVGLREGSVVLRNGRTAQRRLFVMNEAVAQMIRAKEKAELQRVDSPTAPSE